jgi:type I restriction enzyme, S subunit
MNDWKGCKLGDVISFGNGKVRPKDAGYIPIYGGNGILGFGNDYNYSDETIIIGRVGAYCGAVYYENKPIWISDNALSAKPKGKNIAKFFYYYLKNLGLNQFAEGSSHPLVTQTLLNSIDVQVPTSFPEQRSIAGVLSGLDDKIELLHRQNKTLEAMAETLFRQWFVEDVDEGWEEKSLYDCALFINGSAFRDEDFCANSNGLPIVKIAEIKAGISNQTKFTEKNVDPKYLIDDEEILFSWSGTPETSLGIFIWMGGKGVLNQHIFKVIPFDIKKKSWIFFLLRHLMSEFIQFASHKQTIGLGHVTVSDLKSMKVRVPPIEILIVRSVALDIIFLKTICNFRQIRILEKLRDTLLLKLMNGEVRVTV